jgi:cobalamin biosynthetic protein CobC
MLEHGGNLLDAVRHFARPLEEWIDLSTGINPHYYPVPSLSGNAWHRLPEHSEALLAAACAYYGAPQMLAVAGSQAAIQALPRLRPPSRVLVSAPSYAEHAYQWQRAGHQLIRSNYAQLDEAVKEADVVVLCQPNNPTGEMIPPATLLDWRARLAVRGGWLIVDEAFADTLPASSVAAATSNEGLIVLRSVGKFFGLAGIRLGFVAATTPLLQRLADALGPWAISGPAQEIAIAALRNRAWQRSMRVILAQDGQRLRTMLKAAGIQSNGTDLFQWCSDAGLQQRSEALWKHMATHGIWIRRFTAPEVSLTATAQATVEHQQYQPHGVRFGLPGTEAAWQRLEQALNEWTKQ